MGELFRNTKCCVIIMLDTQLTLVYNLRNSKLIWQLPDFEGKINVTAEGRLPQCQPPKERTSFYN
jgi:hypothetical protein